MSFSADLSQNIRDNIIELAESIQNKDVGDFVFALESDLTHSLMQKLTEPVLVLNENRANKLSGDRYDQFVNGHAITVTEAFIFEHLKNKRLLREVSEDLENDLKRSANAYADICEEYGQLEPEIQRNRREGLRRDRPRRSGGGNASRGRHDRDEPADRPRPKDRYRNQEQTSRPSRDNRHDRDGGEPERKRRGETPVIKVSAPALEDGDIITSKNYTLLPLELRDLPMYFAGNETLIYEDGKVVTLLDTDKEMEYEKHRTDVFLAPNRQPKKIGSALDDMDRKLLEAARERVEAYETYTDETSGEELERLKIQPVRGSSIAKGVISVTDVGVFEDEQAARIILKEVFGENVFNHVFGCTLEHTYNLQPSGSIDDLERYKELTASLSLVVKLDHVRELLELSSRLFSSLDYAQIFNMLNACICNALSASMKVGLRTTSILNDWASVDKFIKSKLDKIPGLAGIINTNLAAAIPTFVVEENQYVKVRRHYIFLPMSKNELTIASPIRYATLNKSHREELYGAIEKLETTNPNPGSGKALVTLVTSENESLILFHNRDLLNDNGYYVFAPVGKK